MRDRFALPLLLVVTVLAGCAGLLRPSVGDLDVSQLVRTEPADLQVIDVLPRGIGSTGRATLVIAVRDDDPRVATQEAFELVRAGEQYEAQAQRTVVTYVLRPEDRARFTQAMVRLRAQMLAGYANVGIGANTYVCDEAGVTLAGGPAPTLVRNAGTGRTILTIPPAESPAAIKERVPFCT